MKNIVLFLVVLFCFASCSVFAKSNQALVLTIDSKIGPAEQHYLQRGLAKAQENDDNLIIIQLNSNGGSLRTIRRINDLFLLTSIPIITFVYPEKASVSNESFPLIYASHLTAMAPHTTIGITHTGSDADDDIVAHVAKNKLFSAYIGSLASLRGRNADWAKRSVINVETLTPPSAYEKKVIDEIASDLPELLLKMDGHQVRIHGVLENLKTKELELVYFPPDLHYKLFKILTDPVLIYALIFLSTYAMIFEFTSPIHLSFFLFILALGVFLLSFYLLHFWAVHYFGLSLIVGGILLSLIGRTKLMSLLWKIPGIVCFASGSFLLFINTPYAIPPGLITFAAAILVLDVLLKMKK